MLLWMIASLGTIIPSAHTLLIKSSNLSAEARGNFLTSQYIEPKRKSLWQSVTWTQACPSGSVARVGLGAAWLDSSSTPVRRSGSDHNTGSIAQPSPSR
jgi:hypothetical protein